MHSERYRNHSASPRHLPCQGPSDAQDELRKELKLMIRESRRASKSRRRFAARRYLRAVYGAYFRWELKGDIDKTLRRAARLRGVDMFGEKHPIRAIIDLTTEEPDLKVRSRWTR